MSRPPSSFVAMFGRTKLAEMLAPSYAGLKNLDLDDSYRALEEALRDLRLIEGIQAALWAASLRHKTGLDQGDLVEHVGKKLARRKVFKAPRPTRATEPPLMALVILIDRGAGVSSGEAVDLLETPEGQALLLRGFEVLGDHLAAQIFR